MDEKTADGGSRQAGMTRRQVLGAVGAGVALGSVPGVTFAEERAGSTERAAALSGQGGNPVSWFGTMGTHYRLDTGRWLGLTRDRPRPNGAIGFLPDVTEKKPAGIEPVTGRFSGEQRFYDFTGAVHGDQQRGNFEGILHEAMNQSIDQVWITGNVNYGNRPEWVEFLIANNGKYFKDLLYEAVKHFNSGEFADRSNTIYWEIGNENNNTRFFSLRDHGDPQINNRAHADDYVNFYLTPALDAIYTASRELYSLQRSQAQRRRAPAGFKQQVKVLAANVSGARGATRAFLDYILNSTITQEDRVQAQRWMLGKRVWKVIDRFSVHYTMHGAGDGGASDRSVLESLHSDWVDSGKIRGFLSTEELGFRGLGAHAVAQRAFRWLDFWLGKPWDEHTGRMCFWGDEAVDHPNTDTEGWEAQDLLGPFLRDWPLTRAGATGEVVVNATQDCESYALRATTPEGHWRYAIHVMPVQAVQGDLQSVQVSYQPAGPRTLHWSNITHIDTVTAPEQAQPEDVIVDDDGILIVLNKPLNINDSYLIRVHLTP